MSPFGMILLRVLPTPSPALKGFGADGQIILSSSTDFANYTDYSDSRDVAKSTGFNSPFRLGGTAIEKSRNSSRYTVVCHGIVH